MAKCYLPVRVLCGTGQHLEGPSVSGRTSSTPLTVCVEKLIVTQVVKKLPALNAAKRFSTVVTKARQLLSCTCSLWENAKRRRVLPFIRSALSSRSSVTQ
jgi:hypothetical protein